MTVSDAFNISEGECGSKPRAKNCNVLNPMISEMPFMAIVLPALAVSFPAFCVWLAVRIFNRRERWTKWTAIALAPVVLYAGAYLAMTRPFLISCRRSFSVFAFVKPAYVWPHDGQLAGHQIALKALFAPAFAVHRFVDPNWPQMRPGTYIPVMNEVSEEEVISDVASHSAWPADDVSRSLVASWDRRKREALRNIDDP